LKPSIVDVVVDSKLQYFKKSFQSLINQTYTDFELLLCVGYPGTLVNEYLAGFDELPFKLNIIQEPPRERYPARASANNLGLNAATGDIYIGTQDDVIFPDNWVERHIWWHETHDAPIFVYNQVTGAIARTEEAQSEDEWWQKKTNPRHLPIASRWQYASGHSFSMTMSIAKTIKHDERYNGNWGFEDIDWSYQAFLAGCKFYIDTECKVFHQDHGDKAIDRRRRGKEEFMDWLRQRSRNRRVFADKWGFDPEYGIVMFGGAQ
jgi:hypothetical protein